METILHDRVRKNSPRRVNEDIDIKTEENIQFYASRDEDTIRKRISELDKEWDVERSIELWASVLTLAGVALATKYRKNWWILPAVTMSFMVQHALQGWCPPVSVFRALRVRTRKEIDEEKYALISLLDKKAEINAGDPRP